jgi:hypothetical protein
MKSEDNNLTPAQERMLEKMVHAAIMKPDSVSAKLHVMAAKERIALEATDDSAPADQLNFQAYMQAATKLQEEIEAGIKRKWMELSNDTRLTNRQVRRKFDKYEKEQLRILKQ